MPALPERKRVGAGIFLGLVLVVWLGWGTLKPQEATGKIRAARPVTASSAPANSPLGASSRMIEAEPAETRLAAKDNAATDWRKAFALADKLTQREEKMIRDQPLDPPATPEEIAALLAKIDPIILLLRQGAAKPGCDWGLLAGTLDVNYAHLTKAVMLSKIAVWDSIQRVAEQPGESVANLKALDQLGNSLRIGTVSAVVTITIRSIMTNFTSNYASQLPAENRHELLTSMRQSSYLDSIQEAMNSEGDSILGSLASVKSGHKSDGSALSDEDKTNLRRLYGDSSENNQKIADDLRYFTNTQNESLYWPNDQYKTWLTQFKETSSIPPKNSVLESYVMIRSDLQTIIVRQSMAEAGLAVMEGGVAALAQVPNPLTGNPFVYRAVDANGSFELQSAASNKGSPVTLTFKMPSGN